MTLSPLTDAPVDIQIHILAALIAAGLGPVAIYRRRRDRAHRIIGRIWVTSMAILAATGLMIPAVVLPLIGPFGPIHLLSFWVIWTLWRGVSAIRRGDRTTHAYEMRSLYWQGLAIAGLLALLPGRRLNAMIFGEAETTAYWVIGVIGALAIGAWAFRRTQKPIL